MTSQRIMEESLMRTWVCQTHAAHRAGEVVVMVEPAPRLHGPVRDVPGADGAHHGGHDAAAHTVPPALTGATSHCQGGGNTLGIMPTIRSVKGSKETSFRQTHIQLNP